MNQIEATATEIKTPSTMEEYGSIQQLALAGYYYIKEQKELGHYSPNCTCLLKFAKEVIDVFGKE